MAEPELPASDLDEVLVRCADDWQVLAGARILITGGTGFFGRWLIASLLRADARHRLGLKLVVATRDRARVQQAQPWLAAAPAVELVQADVRTLEIPSGAMTHIVHMAAEASAKLNAERPLEMIGTIVDGTRRILEIACAGRAARMLFVSSGAVYGRQPSSLAAVPEDHLGGPDPLHPAAAYGEAKRLAEQMCAAVARARGIAIPIARCWAFVGPGLPLDAHFAAGNLIRDALAGGPLVIRGDGTAVRSYLYAADLATWLIRILVRGVSLRPYNVGSDRALSIADLAQEISKAMPAPMAVDIRGQAMPGSTIDRYVPDIARARAELGLEPWTGLAEAIGKTIAWHRQGRMVSTRTLEQGR